MNSLHHKRINKILIALLLTLVFGCSDDAVLHNADKVELEMVIAEAKSTLNSTTEGMEIGQMASGSKERLTYAISEAEAFVQEDVSQQVVDHQVTTLATELNTYRLSANFELVTGWSKISNLSNDQIRDLVTSYEPESEVLISTRTLNQVDVYKLSYRTLDIAGNEITASGLVIFPKGVDDLPILSYQHGTITSQAEAPSMYSPNYGYTVLGTIFATVGYAVILPDYLGYGDSQHYPHPYEHGRSLGQASYDMLRASKEFFAVHTVTLNEQLFLAGYSEGGYATMAMHKHIEENSDLEVTMSAPASGAYNKSAFVQELMGMESGFNFQASPIWVIDAYDWVYELNRDWTQYLSQPYADRVQATHNPFDYQHLDLASISSELYTADFINGVLNQTDTDFLNVIADNDNFDWAPQYPITLYYGDADDWVLPLNSITAYEHLSAKGADVDVVVFEGKDHFTAQLPYALSVFELFESIKR